MSGYAGTADDYDRLPRSLAPRHLASGVRIESSALQPVSTLSGPISKFADDLFRVRQRRHTRKPLELGSEPDKDGVELASPVGRRQLERQRSDEVLGGAEITVYGEGSEWLEVRHDEEVVVVATRPRPGEERAQAQ